MPWRRAHPSQIEIVWELKAHKLATVEQTNVAGKNGEWQLEHVKAERARFSRGSILHELCTRHCTCVTHGSQTFVPAVKRSECTKASPRKRDLTESSSSTKLK